MNHRLTAPVATLLSAALLSACGGGGGGSGSGAVPTQTPTPPPASCNDSAARVPQDMTRRVASRAVGSGVDPSRLYVTYRSAGRAVASAAESVGRTIAAVHTMPLGVDGGLAHAVVTLPAGADATQAAQRLRADADVVSVSPTHFRRASCTALANDTRFNNVRQWYLLRTVVADPSGNDAWSLTHGAGVTVAVIDTGVDETNQDLAQKMDLRESVVNGVVKTGPGSVQDTNGHGTNTAGLIAAATNNTFGYASGGWDVRLQVFKIFPDETANGPDALASTSDEARAIRDAVANGASVISMSLGFPQAGNFDQAEHDAVEAAIAAGVTVVAAGGNEFPAAGSDVPDFPAGYPGVIAVGASAVQDTQANVYASIVSENAASYSNSGVTMLAPGGDPPAGEGNGSVPIDDLHWIEGYSTTTAAKTADQCSNSGGVCAALFAGTSQATPQVAATAALMMAFHGGAHSLSPAQVTALLRQTADALPGVPAARQGAGRLNAFRAVSSSR